MNFLCDSIYFITVFLFGAAASVCFTGVPFNRKNILSLSASVRLRYQSRIGGHISAGSGFYSCGTSSV